MNHVYVEFQEPTQDFAQLPESSQEEVDTVAGVATAGALVSFSPPQTKRKHPDRNNSKDAWDAVRAKRDALNSAVLLPTPNTANTTTAALMTTTIVTTTEGVTTAVSSPGGVKSTDGVYNNWLELYDERDGVVFDLDDIKKAWVHVRFPIAYCINNKDVTDEANFILCILHKVRKEQYELFNSNDDYKIDDDLDLGGDEGLSNLWTTYVKYPSKTFVDTFWERLENNIADTNALDESPKRADLCNKAAANMTKKALAVRGHILKKSPELVIKTGDVVLVPLDDVDRTKVDGGNLIGNVVSTNKLNSTCQVVVKHGLLHRAYVYHAVKAVAQTSNNIDLHDL